MNHPDPKMMEQLKRSKNRPGWRRRKKRSKKRPKNKNKKRQNNKLHKSKRRRWNDKGRSRRLNRLIK